MLNQPNPTYNQFNNQLIKFQRTNSMKQIKTNKHHNHLKMREFPLPPPSPIPTGKGLRSSAINDEILSDFLTSSLHIPKLKLPISFQSRRILIPAVDLRSVLSADGASVERVLRFASEFGFFGISGHGIPVTELQPVSKLIATIGAEELSKKKSDEFDLCWAGKEEENVSIFNPDTHPDPVLSECLKTELVKTELVNIGKSLWELFAKTGNGFGTRQWKASTDLEILNCNVEYKVSKSQALSNDEEKYSSICENALGLYLASGNCEVLVQLGSESFVFNAGPDTIVAILGQQLEVDGGSRNVPTKLMFVVRPVDGENSTSHPLIFSTVLKLVSTSNKHDKQLDYRVSVSDQMLIGALIVLLIQLVLWACKSI